MTILDTNMIIRKAKARENISENITSITQIEYPPVLEYEMFYGEGVYASEEDIDLATSIQIKLRKIGKTQSAQDLIIAAVCINRNELLITTDKDFKEIESVSKLRMKLESLD